MERGRGRNDAGGREEGEGRRKEGRRVRKEEGGKERKKLGGRREGGKRVKVLREGRRVTKDGKVSDVCRAGASLSAHEVLSHLQCIHHRISVLKPCAEAVLQP